MSTGWMPRPSFERKPVHETRPDSPHPCCGHCAHMEMLAHPTPCPHGCNSPRPLTPVTEHR